jgi:hypothetical protein
MWFNNIVFWTDFKFVFSYSNLFKHVMRGVSLVFQFRERLICTFIVLLRCNVTLCCFRGNLTSGSTVQRLWWSRGSIYAAVKILLNNHGSDGWTGFKVDNNSHIIIMTVAHAVNAFNDSIICSGNTFEYDFKSDVLILRCDHPYPLVTTYFKFGNLNYKILSSTSVICILYPVQRDWMTLCGTVCRKPVRIGENQGNFDPRCFWLIMTFNVFQNHRGPYYKHDERSHRNGFLTGCRDGAWLLCTWHIYISIDAIQQHCFMTFNSFNIRLLTHIW